MKPAASNILLALLVLLAALVSVGASRSRPQHHLLVGDDYTTNWPNDLRYDQLSDVRITGSRGADLETLTNRTRPLLQDFCPGVAMIIGGHHDLRAGQTCAEVARRTIQWEETIHEACPETFVNILSLSPGDPTQKTRSPWSEGTRVPERILQEAICSDTQLLLHYGTGRRTSAFTYLLTHDYGKVTQVIFRAFL
jgi:hypothetical protein